MVVESFDQVLIYGFALFFVFAVIVWQVLRYSNRQVLEKMDEMKKNHAGEITRLDQELRKMVLIHAREQKEIYDEISRLKGESGLTGERKREAKKIKAVA